MQPSTISTPKHIVVMPTLKRPEMLALALESLERTKQSNLEVRIFVDHTDESRLREVEFVRDTYFPEASIFHAAPHVEAPSGMWNILNSLKHGYESGAEYIFLVEEDVLVYPDFFEWHFVAQRSGQFLATCGRRMLNLPLYNQYTNPGSCFSRFMLGLVNRYINDELFADRLGYMERCFGKMDEVSDLDDGLIRRFAKHHHLDVLYPVAPKCAHIGFRAYNHYMDWVNEGDIERRIDNLRKMLPTIDRNNKFTGDYEPYNFPV